MGVVFTGLFAFGLVLFTKIKSDLHLDHILFGNILGLEPGDLRDTLIVSGIVLAVILVTLSFGIGQPALASSVGDAVEEDVRGVALGVATLVFMVGGSVGSALVGGLGHVAGADVALLVLTLLPLLGILLVVPLRRRDAS